jgi:hypothetical protein
MSSLIVGLLFVLIALYAVAKGWKRVERKRRATVSLTWPLIAATIEQSSIERNEHSDGGSSWTLRLNFTYRPQPGSPSYDGVYVEELGFKADAETQLLSLRERQLYARYNPSDPGKYFMDPYRDIFKDEHVPPPSILKY